MRIWLDPDKLQQYRADARRRRDARSRAERAGLGRPARRRCRRVAGQQLNATVTAQSRLQTPEQFRRRSCCKATADGSLVRLRDVARVELGAENYGVAAPLQRHAGVRPRRAAGRPAPTRWRPPTRVKAAIDRARAALPAGHRRSSFPYDTTPFVTISIEEVVKTLIEAIVLVFLVMFLFLQNLRATLIPTIAVPVVLLGTFGVLAVVRLLDQHADHVRHGAGHRPAGRRRHRGGRERRAGDARGGPVAAEATQQVDGRRSPAR